MFQAYAYQCHTSSTIRYLIRYVPVVTDLADLYEITDADFDRLQNLVVNLIVQSGVSASPTHYRTPSNFAITVYQNPTVMQKALGGVRSGADLILKLIGTEPACMATKFVVNLTPVPG